MTQNQIKQKAEELYASIANAPSVSGRSIRGDIDAAVESFLTSFHAEARNDGIEECRENLEEQSYEAMRNSMRDGVDESRIKASTFKSAAMSIRSLKSIQP